MNVAGLAFVALVIVLVAAALWWTHREERRWDDLGGVEEHERAMRALERLDLTRQREADNL